MSNLDINIYNNNKIRKNDKSKSVVRRRSIVDLNWATKICKTLKKKSEKTLEIRIVLNTEEIINNAKIHRQANRPLKKIKEFDDVTKFCQCCYNPMKDKVHLTNFNFCDNTDEYAEFGRGISFYFFYFKYASIILLLTFFMISLPCMLFSKKCTEEMINICKKIYTKDYLNISNNIIYSYCNDFINITEDSIIYNHKIIILLKFNSVNIKRYRDIYLDLTDGNDNINKVLIDYNLIFFISLFTLFIIHSLYTTLLFNINKHYDMSVTSPGDYAIIISNLQSSFEIFFSEINRINKLIQNRIENKEILNNNFIKKEDEDNSSRNLHKECQVIGLEKMNKDKIINTYKGFNEFIKNIICGNENGKPYNIFLVNICYKINEFQILNSKIEKKKSEIYIAMNDPEQIKKNKNSNTLEKDKKYFYYPLDIFKLYICPFTLFQRNIKISKIKDEKKELERKIEILLDNTKNITKENFSGVVFIIFNSMEEKDKFLKLHNTHFLINIICNLKYYLFCCINKTKRRNFYLKKNIFIENAPEPEDIIYENLEFSWVQRFYKVLFIYIISFILIAISFFFIFYLNSLQIKKSQNESKENITHKYIISVCISLIIVIINSFFQKILIILTKIEKQISMTNFLLSYSIKLTILTFSSSAILPFLSSYYYNKQSNHEILLTNCLTMFLSNSFLIPITWTFNFEFFIKKLRKFIILKKNKHLPQKELNNLYELLDMKIASKYSYITTTLLISFFYLPIFPLGILISFIGFIFSFFLEKYNFINKYKKPIMLNNRIYEVYSNYFLIILFMASLGDYLFLKSVFNSKFAHFANIITFAFLLIIPYNKLLSIDFIKIKESDIKKEELYEDNFYKFFNDYERNNPITKKDGIKHFLDKLLEKVLINQKEYDTILQNYENMNLLELYYKSKLHLGCNLLKRVFSLKNNSDKNNNNNLIIYNRKKKIFNNSINKDKDKKDNQKEYELTEEKQYNLINSSNIYKRNQRKVLSNKDKILINYFEQDNNNNIIRNIKNKKKVIKNRIKNNKDINDIDMESKNQFFDSKRNKFENE